MQKFFPYRKSRVHLLFLAISFCTFSSAFSQEDAKPATKTRTDLAPQFLATNCRACHAGAKPKGDFHDKDGRSAWLAALEQIESGNMPPAKRPRPTQAELKSLTTWINTRVAKAEADLAATQGRVVLRRLNRNEYANTMRDLLGVDIELKDLLPLSTSTTGFDNSAESLHVSANLLDSYLAAADRALDAAIANGPRPRTVKEGHDIKDEKTVKATGSVYRHVDDGVAIFSSWVSANIQVTLWRFMTRNPGRYRIRISGYGFQTDDPVTFHVKGGPMNASAQQYMMGYYQVPANKPTVVEFVTRMEDRETIRIITDALGAIPPQVEKIGAENYKGPGLVIQWVEIEGPLLDSWPPQSHRQIFGDMQQQRDPADRNRQEVVSQEPLVDAERILRDLARRAFRRPVTNGDIQPFLDRVEAKLADGYSFETAMRVGLKAVLVSPNFLFLRETAADAAQALPLDEFSLASRLSYFLWSSMPDEELLKLAEQRKLREANTLHEQVERMLRDPKAAAFTEDFTGQWLGLRAIDATTPDRMLYPEYDDILKVSMVKEATLFFDEVLQNNLSLLDQTMVYLGSNLGNASSHSVKNLPVLLAGGGFQHGRHLPFDPQNPPPLCNLYVSMLQQLGIEADSFGTSTGTLTGLS